MNELDMPRCASEGACPSGESRPNIESEAEDAMTARDAPVTAGAAFTEEGALEAAEDAMTAGDAPVTAGCNTLKGLVVPHGS